MSAVFKPWVITVVLAVLAVNACEDHSKIKRLRKDVRELKNDSVRLTSVRLTPGVAGYQVIRHSLGSATLTLEKLEATAKGSVVTIEIGNLTAVRLTGATMTISYPRGAIEQSFRYDVQQPLEAGKAARFGFVLEGVQPAELTHVRISQFEPSGIQLIRPN